MRTLWFLITTLLFAPAPVLAQPAATGGLHPNLLGQTARPLRYRPDHGDFVIDNGVEAFNRPLYGGHSAFRVDGGDKPEFVMYLPGRGGNLRLGIRTQAAVKWLKDAAHIVTRYRPGELIYDVDDPLLGAGQLKLEVLAYAATEGMAVRATGSRIPAGAELIWAYGGVNGQRGARDGDIGTEKVPISQWFQFQPEFTGGNSFTLAERGFTLTSPVATIAGVVPQGARQHIADGAHWDDPAALLDDTSGSPAHPVIAGEAPLRDGAPSFLSLQRVGEKPPAAELDTYREVAAQKPAGTAAAPLLRAFTAAELPARFDEAENHFNALRNRVRIETPDPWLDASMGALNIVADAVWDDDAHAIMHGAIAWRTKLLGWRGPYVLDDLGWHERARRNFNTWLPNQNTQAIPAGLPAADEDSNLARNETGLHSNGDLSNSHYDMNMVFIDALLRHILWTGDADYARKAWPVIKHHLAWEQRLFRREFGPGHLPLYEAYATIWASDDLYYSGGGTSYASAYNLYANRMAARIAALAGDDPTPYAHEAELIDKAMHTLLWLPDQGAYSEAKDWLGLQRVHADYGLWSFYHTIDEEAASPRQAWQMGEDLRHHLRPIPVEGPGVPSDRPYHVLSETDWMPYTWSINNVVMDENMHTALGLWQSGHADDAYTLAKGAILASMYMGISPGNAGTMDYLDAYRRESQRDFADSAGTMSRALIEGLFGIRPDALSGELTVAPGFPPEWNHARLDHPDVGIDFRRDGQGERWTITQPGQVFRTLRLRIPAAFARVASVTVDGKKAAWRADADAVGRPMLEIVTPAGQATHVVIHWQGRRLTAPVLAATVSGERRDGFVRKSVGDFRWWSSQLRPKPQVARSARIDWAVPMTHHLDAVDLSAIFNDRVTNIFAPGKYRSPRSPFVSLSLPSQGVGAWAGHVKLLPVIDDSGLRRVAQANEGRIVIPNGIGFATPGAPDAPNIAFTSLWDNYPHDIVLPLSGQARRVYLLMAGSTNAMQSRIDNGEVVVAYTDGSTARLALRNPETWWPIEQDYFIDDYQFPYDGPLPPRIDLKTGKVRLLDSNTFKGQGRDVPGGSATVLDLPLDPAKTLKSLTVRTLSNDVIIGLMSATLERPD